LYLSKNSIEKKGGSLTAISDTGKGATFTIILDA
jgi:signal transduction histidine kinase